MRIHWVLSLLALCVLVSTTAAQVDVIISNTHGSAGTYKDSITMISAAGVQRPLAQHPNTSTGGTGNIFAKPMHLNLSGVDYLYWACSQSDVLYRGTDSNGNGVIDPTEFEDLWGDSVLASGSWQSFAMDEFNGTFALSIDFGSPNYGIWLLTDLDGNGDYYGAGEYTEILNGGGGLSGATVPVGFLAVAASSDDIEALGYLSNGDIVWGDDDDKIFVRTDPATGIHTSYLVYQVTIGAAAPLLVQNPDFAGGLLPMPGSVSGTSEDVDLIGVDRTTDSVYLGVNFEDDEPWIYKCTDGNANGDANDAGEVTLFWDGNISGLFIKPALDNIVWYQGSLYVSIEEDPSTTVLAASVGHFLQLTDLNGDNDANDAGEMVILNSLAPGDDPTSYGLCIVPAGTFDVPGWTDGAVRCSLNDSGIDQLASSLVFTFEDIPPVSQTSGTDIGVVALSLTGDGGLLLGANTVVGLDFDFFTSIMFLPLFFNDLQTVGITGPTEATPGLALPAASFPPGFEIYYAGAILGPGGVWVSQSRMITVQ